MKVLQNEKEFYKMKKMNLANVDVSQPMTISAHVSAPGIFDPRICGGESDLKSSLVLSAKDCALWCSWLSSNSNWKGKANKSFSALCGDDEAVMLFDSRTFTRMHGVGIRPISSEQFDVFRKIYKWQMSFMDGESIVSHRRRLENEGLRLSYVVWLDVAVTV